MSIRKLPYEILENIFRVLFKSTYEEDLLNCVIVCRSWLLPASRVLYEKIYVEEADHLLYCFINQTENKGAFCKDLEFNRSLEEFLTPEEYKQFLSYFPNLQRIVLEESDPAYDLEQLRRNASLIQHVKNISLKCLGWGSENLQAYYDCAIAFKHSLQNIRISSLDTAISDSNGRIGNMITFLPEFNCLTNLDIINESLPQLCMFAVMHSCPNLINFTFHNQFQEPEDDFDNYRFDHSKLRFLDIKVPEVTQNHINYLVTNITQLNHIKIYCGVSDHIIDDWMDRIGVDNLNKFGVYINGIKKVEFRLGHQLKLDPNNFWPLTNNFIKKSPTPTVVFLSVFDKQLDFGQTMSLQKSSIDFLIHCNMRSRELLPLNHMVNLPESVRSIIAPPGLKKYEVLSYYIHFDIEDVEEKAIGDLYVNALDVIMNCFTALSKFDMKFGRLNDIFHFQFKVCSNKIEYDKEYQYNPRGIRPVKESFLDLPSHFASDYERFAYVTIWRIQSAADITSIMKMLPATRYLKLLECDFALDKQSNFTLDINRLSLRQFKLDISSLIDYGRGKKSIVLQIEEGESDQRKYFEWDRDSRNSEEIIFEAVDITESSKQKRFSSSSCNFFIIKCQRMEQIIVSASTIRSRSLIAILNLKLK